MNFTHYDLGMLSGGEVIEVSLQGTEANVRLLDNPNFGAYRSGRQHRYFGGHTRQSPVMLTVPSTGHWHVAVDLGGYGGSARSSVWVL